MILLDSVLFWLRRFIYTDRGGEGESEDSNSSLFDDFKESDCSCITCILTISIKQLYD